MLQSSAKLWRLPNLKGRRFYVNASVLLSSDEQQAMAIVIKLPIRRHLRGSSLFLQNWYLNKRKYKTEPPTSLIVRLFDAFIFQTVIEFVNQNCKPWPNFYVDWVPRADTSFYSPGLPGLVGQELEGTQSCPFQNVPEGQAHPGSGQTLVQTGSRCLLLQDQAQGTQSTHTWLLGHDCGAVMKNKQMHVS